MLSWCRIHYPNDVMMASSFFFEKCMLQISTMPNVATTNIQSLSTHPSFQTRLINRVWSCRITFRISAYYGTTAGHQVRRIKPEPWRDRSTILAKQTISFSFHSTCAGLDKVVKNKPTIPRNKLLRPSSSINGTIRSG
jgi:hypothetical protein